MSKRFFCHLVVASALSALCLGALHASEVKLGVLMLHGKNPGNNRDPHFRSVMYRLEREGMLVSFPNMPWSSTRYIDGHWDMAMTEMAERVKELRGKGATHIVLMGHSLGVPAAMSYAARGGDVQALVLLAPGHVPSGFYSHPRFTSVRDSVNEARALVAAGKGAERGRFNDINQGRTSSVSMTATDYLSYFDPASDADMSVTAPRVPATVPVFTAIGDTDPLAPVVRAYYVDKLPANVKNHFVQVQGNHLNTPEVALPQVLDWLKSAVAE